MNRKRWILAAIILALSVSGLGAGWTLAWLTSETKSMKNVFFVGSVKVQLTETFNIDKNADGEPDSWEGILVPGTLLIKNPQVIIPDDCEDSWIFVHLQETDWPDGSSTDSKISYMMDESWQRLPNSESVYFREFGREDDARSFYILEENQIKISETLTKLEMASIGQPKLTVTAYAIQRAGFDSPEDAWKQVEPKV